MQFFLLSLAISRGSYIVTESYITQGLRQRLSKLSPTIKESLHCVHCTSIQLSLIVALFVPLYPLSGQWAVNYILNALALSGGAILCYGLIDLFWNVSRYFILPEVENGEEIDSSSHGG